METNPPLLTKISRESLQLAALAAPTAQELPNYGNKDQCKGRHYFLVVQWKRNETLPTDSKQCRDTARKQQLSDCCVLPPGSKEAPRASCSLSLVGWGTGKVTKLGLFFPFSPPSRANTPPFLQFVSYWPSAFPTTNYTHKQEIIPASETLPAFHILSGLVLVLQEAIVSYLKSRHEESLLQASMQAHMPCHNQQVYWSPVSAGKWEENPSSPGPLPGEWSANSLQLIEPTLKISVNWGTELSSFLTA